LCIEILAPDVIPLHLVHHIHSTLFVGCIFFPYTYITILLVKKLTDFPSVFHDVIFPLNMLEILVMDVVFSSYNQIAISPSICSIFPEFQVMLLRIVYAE
jgi:hypothetical protein